MLDVDAIVGCDPLSRPEPTGKRVNVHRGGARHFVRKAASEAALCDALDWYFEPGDCYHCFSFGDVDAQSYIKHILRQQRAEYLAISTWCMAAEDVKDLAEWHRSGAVGRVDLFVGEIFRGSYPDAYDAAQALIAECGGRLAVFRNHAKVAVVRGERFDCLIESSANVNTNPRSENTVLTVDTELCRAYARLFAEINPFNAADCGAAPYVWDDR